MLQSDSSIAEIDKEVKRERRDVRRGKVRVKEGGRPRRDSRPSLEWEGMHCGPGKGIRGRCIGCEWFTATRMGGVLPGFAVVDQECGVRGWMSWFGQLE